MPQIEFKPDQIYTITITADNQPKAFNRYLVNNDMADSIDKLCSVPFETDAIYTHSGKDDS